jgi:hypothetical protein
VLIGQILLDLDVYGTSFRKFQVEPGLKWDFFRTTTNPLLIGTLRWPGGAQPREIFYFHDVR